MQVVQYLRSGVYTRTKKELLPLLSSDEAELLRCSMDWAYYDERKTQNADALFQRMLTWTGSVMRELAREETLKGVSLAHTVWHDSDGRIVDLHLFEFGNAETLYYDHDSIVFNLHTLYHI